MPLRDGRICLPREVLVTLAPPRAERFFIAARDARLECGEIDTRFCPPSAQPLAPRRILPEELFHPSVLDT